MHQEFPPRLFTMRTRAELLLFIMSMKYTKQPLSVAAQIQLLQTRGLTILNIHEAESTLSQIGYFRFAEYLRPMEQDKVTHNFKPKSYFADAHQLYLFDRELRILLFDAIQSVEILLRSQIIQIVSTKFGAHWYMDVNLFKDSTIFANTNAKIQYELKRSKEDYIQEYYRQYTNPFDPPVWKTLEVVTFGTLSKLFENLADKSVKKAIAQNFGLPQHLYLENWIQCITVLRNLVCHHNRVWNRKFAVKPQLPKRLTKDWISTFDSIPAKLYWQLCLLQYLLQSAFPKNQFATRLKKLISSYPSVDVSAMGFPKDWQAEPLWQ